ncbi:MAG: hypothetical protein ACLQU5_16875 [Isosphaeraceae bacterium]
MGKKSGAIFFYQQTVQECRGTPDADQAIVLLKKLGGRVPSESESVPPKEADPWSPPKRPHYVSTDAAGLEIDQMIAQGMQAAVRANSPGTTYIGPRGGTYHYSASGNKVYGGR